jgi:hypothetical protein
MAAKLKPQMWQASAGSGHDSGESTEANSGRQDGDEDVERRNHGDLPAHGGNVRATSGDETYQDSAGHDQQSVTDIERNDHDDARTMRAILVESYGDTSRLLSKDVKRPSDPKGHDILIRYVALMMSLPHDRHILQCQGVLCQSGGHESSSGDL